VSLQALGLQRHLALVLQLLMLKLLEKMLDRQLKKLIILLQFHAFAESLPSKHSPASGNCHSAETFC